MEEVAVKTEVTKKARSIFARIKENKILFYGVPLVVVLFVFLGLFQFILPAVDTYIKSRTINQVLDQNNRSVDTSITNLNKALADEPLLRDSDTALTTYIPRDPKLGEVLNMIQSKAKDFNLESKVGVSAGTGRTSVGTLAKKDEDQKALFQSISSGEIYFQPRSLSTNAEAVLMSIEVSVKGDKRSFLDFLNDTKSLKPLINLVFVEYSEQSTKPDDDSAPISALLRFESYALKFEGLANEVQQVKKVEIKADDASLATPMNVEDFGWDKEGFLKSGITLNKE